MLNRFIAQEKSESHRVSGTETYRQMLRQKVADGQVRKVLVKYDIPISEGSDLVILTDQLAQGFDKLMPYYQATKL